MTLGRLAQTTSNSSTEYQNSRQSTDPAGDHEVLVGAVPSQAEAGKRELSENLMLLRHDLVPVLSSPSPAPLLTHTYTQYDW